MTQEAQNLNFSSNVPPTLEQVQAYFNSLQVPASEAAVFYSFRQFSMPLSHGARDFGIKPFLMPWRVYSDSSCR